VEADAVSPRRLIGNDCMNILRREIPVAKEVVSSSSPDAHVNRRVEVTVERETVTLLLRSQAKGGAEQPAERVAAHALESSQQSQCAPELKPPFASCPICGADGMVLLSEALPGLDLTVPWQEIEGNRVHLHRSPSGDWWVCKQSLHLS